jgi:hypothetical protein
MATFPVEVLINILPFMGPDTFVKMYPTYKDIIDTPYILDMLCSEHGLPQCSTAVEYVSYLSTITGNKKYECMGMIDRMLRAVKIGNIQVFKRLLGEGGKINKKVVLAMGRKHPIFSSYVPLGLQTLYDIATLSSKHPKDINYAKIINDYYVDIGMEASISGKLDLLTDVIDNYSDAPMTDFLKYAIDNDQRDIIKYLYTLNTPGDCLREVVSCHNMWALEYLESTTGLSKLCGYKCVISSLVQDFKIAMYLDKHHGLISWDDVLNSPKEDAQLLRYAVEHSTSDNAKLQRMMMTCSQDGYLASFIYLHGYLRKDPRETLQKIRPIVISQAGMHTHSYLWLQLQV